MAVTYIGGEDNIVVSVNLLFKGNNCSDQKWLCPE